MDNSDLMLIAVAGLAFLAVAGVGLAFAGGGNSEAAAKRARQFSSDQRNADKNRAKGQERARARQTQQMLANLREQNAEKRKSLLPQDIGARMQRAGISAPVSYFWVFSAVLGVAGAAGAYISGADGFGLFGIELRSRPIFVAMSAAAGFLGVPRWLLSMLESRRNKQLTNQFADAIDIIVRGVKSGLPLNECLQIIGRESPEPLAGEFRDLSDSIRMGNTVEQALSKFYTRVPLPEVNFFVIVLNIQTKTGGNLSEALGNLSSIIRARKMMREKIKAMSSEAKASAMIIGSLPFAVGSMVFFTTPSYIMELFTTSTGHGILALGAVLMGLGILVMRNMINFEI